MNAGELAPYSGASDRRRVLWAAIFASSMAFIDGSVVAIAAPAMRADLAATLGDVQWVTNGYLLMLGSLVLLGGALGDRVGLLRTFRFGIGAFTIASLACALAPTVDVLLVARVAQGIAAAIMVPGSLAIIARATPAAERGTAIGLWASASSLTTILGPVLGGVLLTALGHGSWRLVFGINLPLGILAIALLWGLRPDAGHGKRLDVTGALLATSGFGALAYGLVGDGSSPVPPAGHIALWSGLAVVLLGVFVWHEARATSPMVPLRVFRDRAFAGANLLTLALYVSLAGIGFVLPMGIVAGWGETEAVASVSMLPIGIAITLLSRVAGTLSDARGTALPITLGSALVAVGFALLALLAPLHSVWLGVLPAMAVAGIGMGLVVSPLSTAVMTSVDDADQGAASGINNAIARIAGLVAVAVVGGIAGAVFAGNVDAPAHVAFGAPVPASADHAERRAALEATDAAIAAAAWIMAALAAVSAGIAAWTLPWRPLTPRGAATLDRSPRRA